MKKPSGQHDPNVTSLDEARRRAAQKAKTAPRAEIAQRKNSPRDWVIGGAIIVMAVGFLASFIVATPGDGERGPAALSNAVVAE